jgi:hypothetical protein
LRRADITLDPDRISTKYGVIEKPSLNDLSKEVDRFLKAGWHLAGGIAVAMPSDDDRLYFQALEKK